MQSRNDVCSTMKVREIEDAVKQGNLYKFYSLLVKYEKASLGCTSEDETRKGNNDLAHLFHISVRYNRIGMVTYLIDKMNIPVDVRGSLNRTPLQEAARSGHLDMVKLMLKKGANVDALDRDGRTALFLVVSGMPSQRRACNDFDYATLVSLLLQGGASVTAQTLQRACDKRDLQILDILLQSRNSDLMMRGSAGCTVLHWACCCGYSAAVKLILQHVGNKCDPSVVLNAKTYRGFTPLHLASNVEIAELLVARGADTQATDDANNQTPLQRVAAVLKDPRVDRDARARMEAVMDYLEMVETFHRNQDKFSKLIIRSNNSDWKELSTDDVPSPIATNAWPLVISNTSNEKATTFYRGSNTCLVFFSLREVVPQL